MTNALSDIEDRTFQNGYIFYRVAMASRLAVYYADWINDENAINPAGELQEFNLEQSRNALEAAMEAIIEGWGDRTVSEYSPNLTGWWS